jgi:hypothetical protein
VEDRIVGSSQQECCVILRLYICFAYINELCSLLTLWFDFGNNLVN